MSTKTLTATMPIAESGSNDASPGLWSGIRAQGTRVLRRRPWLAAAATLASGITLLATLISQAGLAYRLAAAAALAATAFVWGYWKQGVHRRLFPPLNHLQRRQYAAVWDQLASSKEEACAAAGGRKKDEAEFRSSGSTAVQNILELASIQANDEVLEVGCGVGRIGEAVAAHCSTWTGADISKNMLTHAAERLREMRNVRFVHLPRVDLSPFEGNSFDVVYLTSMLMHLDEMDRWQYAKEAFRVLRPGGTILMDIQDIECDAGWAKFKLDADRFEHLERPPYQPRFSTALQLSVYVARAGFGSVHIRRRSPIAIVTGIKSA